MRTIILIFILISLCFNSLSQTQFQKAIGGSGEDYAISIIQTSDGGFIFAGYTSSFGAGGDDFYIVKFDQNGIIQWTKAMGGIYDDIGLSIRQTSDGGYAFSGETNSFGAGSWDACIVKLDNSGNFQWMKTIGGIDDEYGESIALTTDGGYAVGGYTNSFGAGDYDMYIAKLDTSGNLQWYRTAGTPGYDYAISIKQTSDGGYVLFGSTDYFGQGYTDYFIVKLDLNGSLQWSNTIGGTGGDYGYSVIQTSDGGYALSGTTASFGSGDLNMYIVKLNSSGSLQWTRTVGGTNNDYGWTIIQTTDGGYAAVGSTNSFGAGGYDGYIVKLDNNGSLQWSKTVGGINDDDILNLEQAADGSLIVAGNTASFGAGSVDAFVVKFDANGNTCDNSLNPASISGNGGTILDVNPTVTSPNPIVTSPTPSAGSGGTISNICPLNIKPISNKVPKSFSLSQNYPNPFNPSTKIKFDVQEVRGEELDVRLVIYNVLGKEISILLNEKQNAGSYEVSWDAANNPSGVYFYKLQIIDSKLQIEYTETKRMVLIK